MALSREVFQIENPCIDISLINDKSCYIASNLINFQFLISEIVACFFGLIWLKTSSFQGCDGQGNSTRLTFICYIGDKTYFSNVDTVAYLNKELSSPC